MNTLKKITLVHFRNYNSAEFEFKQPVTCITGPNGSGKTSLLDAVYYLCYTKSYFSAYQQHNVQKGRDGFKVEGSFNKGTIQELISCKWLQGKKDILSNGVEYEKQNDHIGKYAAVMIAPDDMELINGGSELRRKWVDGILGQTDRDYLERLIRYQQLLQQRNAWLKLQAVNPTKDHTQLEYYDRELAADGDYIHRQRKLFTAVFIPMLQELYTALSSGKEAIALTYDSDLGQKPLHDWLRESLQHDLRLQRTLRGIHKDDWDFILNELPLKQFGSQGQKKSFLFAMKLAQFTYLRQKLGHVPILLLDDVFEKLDQGRMEALLRLIRSENFGQVILTDTHYQRVAEAFGSGEIGFIHLQ